MNKFHSLPCLDLTQFVCFHLCMFIPSIHTLTEWRAYSVARSLNASAHSIHKFTARQYVRIAGEAAQRSRRARLGAPALEQPRIAGEAARRSSSRA